MPQNARAYYELTLATARLGMPKHYREDLFEIDRTLLGQWDIPEKPYEFEVPDGEPFAWIVRDSGTDLICRREFFPGIVNHGAGMLRHYGDPMFDNGSRRYFLWDGATLVETNLVGFNRWFYTGEAVAA